MRIMRTIIIPAILALGAAGSIAAGSAAPAVTAVTAQATAIHVVPSPDSLYHG